MNFKQKVELATLNLPPEMQREIGELQRVFACTQENLEKLQKSSKLQEKSTELSIQAREAGIDLWKQQCHNVHTHHDILRKYSQSIAYAPKDTEDLVLGYSHRSAFLMHLQHYEEALVDIDRAWKLTKDNKSKITLQAHKEKCLRLLNELNLVKSTNHLTLTESRELEKIRSKVMNFKPSATVPCAADCVGVGYNEVLGRHLIATRDMNPGEILIIEKGYAASPVLDELYLVCSHCLQYAWNGIPCDKCVYAIYCSEECKNESLDEYHDVECPMLKYLHNMVFNTEQGIDRMVTIRILIMALRKEGFGDIMKEIFKNRKKDNFDGLLSDGILKSNFKACYNLLPFLKEVGTEYEKSEFNILQILYLLVEHTNFLISCIGNNSATDDIIGMNLPQPVFHDNGSITVDPRILLKLKEALVKLKSIVATNGYPIQTGTTQCGYCNDVNEHMKKCQLLRGKIVVPCCSLINHSCTPNLMYLSAPKRKIIAFSTCPIKKGEMLCNSYRSVNIFFGDVKTRGMLLKHFTCKCRACLDNIDASLFTNDHDKDFSKIRNELKKRFSASLAESYFKNPFDGNGISEEIFENMIKISQLVYQQFDYYKAFMYTIQCNAYIESTMAKLYKDKIYMPNDC